MQRKDGSVLTKAYGAVETARAALDAAIKAKIVELVKEQLIADEATCGMLFDSLKAVTFNGEDLSQEMLDYLAQSPPTDPGQCRKFWTKKKQYGLSLTHFYCTCKL